MRQQTGSLFLFAILLTLGGCGDDAYDYDPVFTGGSSSSRANCNALQEYYDNCCYTCGSTDTYCTSSEYDVRGATEPWCEQELRGIDTRYCRCDIF